jgi:hypothetical protein
METKDSEVGEISDKELKTIMRIINATKEEKFKS